MNPKDAEFIVNCAGDNGTSVLVAAVKEGNPMWRTIMDAGWVDAVSSSPSSKNTFLEALPGGKSLDVAKEAFDRFFHKKKPKDINKSFAYFRKGDSLIEWWFKYVHGTMTKDPERIDFARQMVDHAISRGLSLDIEIKVPLRRGTLQTNMLGHLIHQSFWYSQPKLYIEQAEKLISMGAKFDDHATLAVMRSDRPEITQHWVAYALDHGLAKVSDFSQHATDKRVNQDNIPLAQSIAARKTMDAVLGKEKTAAPQ